MGTTVNKLLELSFKKERDIRDAINTVKERENYSFEIYSDLDSYILKNTVKTYDKTSLMNFRYFAKTSNETVPAYSYCEEMTLKINDLTAMSCLSSRGTENNKFEPTKKNAVDGFYAGFKYSCENPQAIDISNAYEKPINNLRLYELPNNKQLLGVVGAGNHRLIGLFAFAPLLKSKTVKLTNLEVCKPSKEFLQDLNTLQAIIDTLHKIDDIFIEVEFQYTDRDSLNYHMSIKLLHNSAIFANFNNQALGQLSKLLRDKELLQAIKCTKELTAFGHYSLRIGDGNPRLTKIRMLPTSKEEELENNEYYNFVKINNVINRKLLFYKVMRYSTYILSLLKKLRTSMP